MTNLEPFPGHSAGREWLQTVANRHYANWLQSKAGRLYARRRKPGSPYRAGFHLPAWIHNAIDALNRGQEERFKAIRMIEAGYLASKESSK